MKTAISIPDPVFQAAETLANRLGVSRSELYSKAVEAFIEKHKNQGVTEKLNEIYSAQSNSLGEDYYQLQRRSIDQDEW
ncbi:hypothetical protein [Methylosarcina fibrata]|uniref:hypothetical protein n=1 Tax=Methylosarcina fibrata TaxID=105972 RepID=UPI0003617E22|nr:hypothetical protein [Methylosarcina fibrata]